MSCLSGANDKFAPADLFQEKEANPFQRGSGDNGNRLQNCSVGVRRVFGGYKKNGTDLNPPHRSGKNLGNKLLNGNFVFKNTEFGGKNDLIVAGSQPGKIQSFGNGKYRIYLFFIQKFASFVNIQPHALFVVIQKR